MTSAKNSKIVVFSLGVEEFGFFIDQVQSIEIVDYLRTIPNLPVYICGVVNLRGTIVPIVDLLFLLTNKKTKSFAGKKMIIVRTMQGFVGVIVDEAKEVVDIAEDMLQNTSITLNETEHCIQLIKIGKRLINLLDADQLLMHKQLEEQQSLEI